MKQKDWIQDVYTHIEENFHETHLPRVKKLVQQPSIAGTGEGIEECSQMVMDMLTDLGCKNVRREYFVHSPVVVGELQADVEDAPTIMMYGMYDVQPADPYDEWTVEPFEGAIKDFPPYGECMVARGVANSKGPLVCFINAVESIKEAAGYLPINILFVVEGEEELGSESLIEFTKKHAEELSKLDAVFLNGTRQDEDGKPFTILGNKGMLYLDVEVTGGEWGGPTEVDLHSMNAAWVGSPVWRLVHALASLRDEEDNILVEGFYDDIIPLTEEDEHLTQRMIDVFDENMYLERRLHAKKFMKGLEGENALRELLWHPTFNLAGLWAGYQGPATKTVLPYKANAKLDIRLLPNQNADDIYNKIRAHLDKQGFEDVKLIKRQGGKYAKTDSSVIAARAAIMAMDNSGLEGGSPWPIFPGHGPAYLFTGPPINIPWVSYGLGQSGRIHAPDEWMTIQGMIDNEKSCAAFIYYLEKLYLEENR